MKTLFASTRTTTNTSQPSGLRLGLWAALFCAATVASGGAWSQTQSVTPGQRQAAQQTASAGVALADLAPGAPDRHTVKAGDTLWAISALFLKQPWRWPELWGMNMAQIQNPHRIYPGQVLVLTQKDGRATLGLQAGTDSPPTVKWSPQVRAESLAEAAIPPIPLRTIEPFLTESLVMTDNQLTAAPRLVATTESRVLLSQGDRAYARGQSGPADALKGQPLVVAAQTPNTYRVFRNATPVKDPETGSTLGYEAELIGKATLLRGETLVERSDSAGKRQVEVVPATLDITSAREEIRVGDRLVTEPERGVPVYIPRAPQSAQSGRIVSISGSAVQNAGQNQVVIINRGTKDGLERGHVLAILKNSAPLTDKTDTNQPS
ncbi:MAG: hypothetical protein RJA09_543, partial [Pseudomonadota bacterium]